MIVWVFQSLYPNGTSIGSAVFAVVTVVSNRHTHRETTESVAASSDR